MFFFFERNRTRERRKMDRQPALFARSIAHFPPNEKSVIRVIRPAAVSLYANLSMVYNQNRYQDQKRMEVALCRGGQQTEAYQNEVRV